MTKKKVKTDTVAPEVDNTVEEVTLMPPITEEARVNKSEIIRQLLIERPELKPQEVVNELLAKGVDVKTGLVSAVKAKIKADANPGKKKTSSSNGTTSSIGETIRHIRELAVQMGGMDELIDVANSLK